MLPDICQFLTVQSRPWKRLFQTLQIETTKKLSAADYRSELHGTGAEVSVIGKFVTSIKKCMWEAGLEALPVPVESLRLRLHDCAK